jgi:hypothetical protein
MLYLSVCVASVGTLSFFLLLSVINSSGIQPHSNRFGKKRALSRVERWQKWETDSCVHVT